ncbi:hypothetical protein LXM94_08540, partial [Rhizobium sp. TRM95111]|uniref:COG4223 family protein n=1 Tax=Rhizobium alarense TaxID=2846851 RepID=UPI001EEF5A02
MDPEKPSRRKKPDEAPVTIDLEANPTSASNEAVVEPAAGEIAGTEAVETDTQTVDAADPSGTGGETGAAEEPSGAETPAEPPPETADAGRADSTPEAAGPVHPAAERRGGNAGAFAAAILGGLIALAGAGALQYGGYLPVPGPDRGEGDGVAALSAEIEALKVRLDESASGAAAPVDLAPITSRLSSLEQRVAAASQSAGGAEAGEAFSALENTISTLSADVAALRAEVEKASARVGAAETRLGERLAAAEEKLEEPRSDVAMARAVAASALKTAIDRGGPYLAELDAFASVAPDDPSIEGLRADAATGVPSRADLVRAFDDVANGILEAVHQPEGDQGIVSRLMSSAASAIRVRPVGSVEGDSPEAIVARIENKLQNGDFKGAQIEWDTLPEVGRSAAAD